MRVVVTGARGFVGPRLCALLRVRGAKPIALDREVDVTQSDAVEAAIARARPDAVVHLAARSSVAESFADPEGYFRVDFLGARHLIAAVARRAPWARVLLVGSGQIYGTRPAGSAPLRESDPLRPASPYAWAKAAADLLGAEWARAGLDLVRVRPFNHTGPGQPATFVASSFAKQIAEIEAGRRPPRIEVGNLDSVRDFLDVEDVVEAYWRLLDPAAPPAAYNVASGRGLTIRELLERLLARAAIQPEVRVDAARLRPTDVSVGCAERLQRVTGWRPRIALDVTLDRLLESWRRRIRES